MVGQCCHVNMLYSVRPWTDWWYDSCQILTFYGILSKLEAKPNSSQTWHVTIMICSQVMAFSTRRPHQVNKMAIIFWITFLSHFLEWKLGNFKWNLIKMVHRLPNSHNRHPNNDTGRKVSEWVSERASQPASEWVSEWMSEWVSEWVSD